MKKLLIALTLLLPLSSFAETVVYNEQSHFAGTGEDQQVITINVEDNKRRVLSTRYFEASHGQITINILDQDTASLLFEKADGNKKGSCAEGSLIEQRNIKSQPNDSSHMGTCERVCKDSRTSCSILVKS